MTLATTGTYRHVRVGKCLLEISRYPRENTYCTGPHRDLLKNRENFEVSD